MTYLKLLLTACFWGGTFISGKMIASSVNPYSAGFIRFVIASFFLLFLVKRMEGRLPPLKTNQIIPIALLGLTGVFAYNIFFFMGLRYIDAGRASLIIATNPIFISLLSAIIFKEPFHLFKGIGIILSVIGAMIVISNGHLANFTNYHFGPGELFICLCVLSWVSYSLIGKAVMGALSPVVSVCYSSVAGALLLLIPALMSGIIHDIRFYSMVDWANLFYLGFFGTVLGFFWYYEGINTIGPMKASVFINFVPISAIVSSHFILNEPITAALFIGAILVITGVSATNASAIFKNNIVKRRS